MGKRITFGYIEIKEHKFHFHKNPIFYGRYGF